VGNLTSQTTEEQLKNLFSTHGEVDSVKIIMDNETGRSRGFAFVEMSNTEEAQNSINALNNQTFESRTITVNEARPRNNDANRFNRRRF